MPVALFQFNSSKSFVFIVGCLIALFSVVPVSAVAQSPVDSDSFFYQGVLRVDGAPVSYTHLRAHETEAEVVCRLMH